MKKLILLNENTDIKLNDTGTIIQFKAQNDGQPVSISNGQTATFRIKNDFGFVKSVKASSSYGGYVFELDTADLSGLVVGSYQVELLIQKDADDALIFPDTAFVGFNITANALTITGEQLPMMSLDEFKNELKTYVDNQTTSAETAIKNDFQSYVNGLSDSTIATANKASEDAQSAISTANGAVDTANTAKSTAESAVQTANSATSTAQSAVDTANTAKNTADTASSKADNAQNTANDAVNKTNANANLITSINNILQFWDNTIVLSDYYYHNQNIDFYHLPYGIYQTTGWWSEKDQPGYPTHIMGDGTWGNWGVLLVMSAGQRTIQVIIDQHAIVYIQTLNNDKSVNTAWVKFTGTSV